MQLTIFRHGIAHPREDPLCPPDFERPLTLRGQRRTRASAVGLAALGIEPVLILTSPLVRARETAEIVADVFGLPRVVVQVTESLSPGADPADFFRELFERDDPLPSALCTGHAPQLDELLAHAIGAEGIPTHLKKAGAALVEVDESCEGSLLWMIPPRVLRAFGREEAG